MTAILATVDPIALSTGAVDRLVIPQAIAALRDDVEAAFQTAPDLAVLALTTAGNGASKIGIQDADNRFTATQVEAALAEVKTIADAALPAAKAQGGTLTLVAGTKTIAAGVTITASSRVLLQMTDPGAGVLGDKYKVTGKVVGGPGVGAFTVTAIANADGSTVATDVSVHDYVVIG
jgi:hypothetical protein